LITSEHSLVRTTGLELLCNLSASDKLHEELTHKHSSDLVQILTALVDSSDEYTAYLAISGLANLAPVVQLSPTTKAKLQALSLQHPADDWTPRLAALS